MNISPTLCRRLACLVLVLLVTAMLAVPAAAVMHMLPGVSVAATEPEAQRLPSLQSAVAVHLKASANSTKIGYLEADRELRVLGSSGDFYKVDCYGMSGYLRKSLVRQAEDGRYYTQFLSGGADTKVFTSRRLSQTIPLKGQIYNIATAQIGIRYLSGGITRNGFDCCGFTYYVYRSCGLEMTRGVEAQLAEGMIIPKESLQCGDLVFFNRTNHPTYYVTHVGMYLGDGKLIHAGSRGITVVNMDDAYFASRFIGARRHLLTDTLDTEDPTGAAGLQQQSEHPGWVRRRTIPTE